MRKNEAEIKAFAILNLSAQESLQNQETSEIATAMRKFMQQTVATFDEAVLHFRQEAQLHGTRQEAIDKLYLDTMGAYREYLDGLAQGKEMEEHTMAEVEEKQEAATEEKKDYIETAKDEINERFQKLFAEKKAFWQLKDAELHRPYNPTYKGDAKGYDNVNAAILMQEQVERGLKDARWMSASELNRTSAVSKKDPSIEPTKILAYSQKRKQMTTIKLYNYADLKGVPEKDNYCPSDNWAETFAKNIKFKADTKIISAAYAATQSIKQADKDFANAVKSNEKAGYEANKAAYNEAKEAYKPQEEERLQALSDYPVDLSEKKFAKMNDEKKFFHEMAKFHQENPENRGYVIRAAKEAMLRGEKPADIKSHIKKLAPMAVYDSLRKDILKSNSYGDYVIGSLEKEMKKDKEFAKAVKNAKSAAR